MILMRTVRRAKVRLGFFALVSLVFGSGALADPGGTVVIGLAQPQASADLSASLQQGLIGRLQSSGAQVVALTASTPDQVEAEARAKGCTQVLYTQLQKKSSGSGFLSKLSSLSPALALGALSGHGGGGSLASMAAQEAAQQAAGGVAASAQQQAMAQSGMAAQTSIKRGDTVTLNYRLLRVSDSTPIKSDSLQTQAGADGQDVVGPLTQQAAGAIVHVAQGSGAALPDGSSAGSSGATGSTTRSGFLGGLLGRHSSGATPPPAAANTGGVDCAALASQPNSPFTADSCQQMMKAKMAYDASASSPGAAHPGDDQMTCDQILAELKQQQYAAPDASQVAQGQAAMAQEQQMLNQQQTTAAAQYAAGNAAVAAATAADTATQMATGGLVDPQAGMRAQQAMMQAGRREGEQMAQERAATEQKVVGSASNLAAGAGQQMLDNPRMARLLQLANSKHCHGGG